MLGIHTVYTKPILDGKPIHQMLQFEVLVMILSCLNWRKHNGPIKLYCDDIFYNYIKDLGIEWLWDEIDTETMKTIPPNVNYNLFWAYPKLYVNSLQTQPFANLDIDLYLRDKFNDNNCDIIFCNLEKCDNNVLYPEYHKLDEYKERLSFDNIDNYASNVALLVVNNLDFYKKYLQVVDDFVVGNNLGIIEGSAYSSLITFIEQRLLFSMIEHYNISYNYQIDGLYDSIKGRWVNGYIPNGVTHLWGWKQKYRLPKFKKEKINLTNELKEELYEDFEPEFNRLKHIFTQVPL